MNFNMDWDNTGEIGEAMDAVRLSHKWVNGPQLADFERDWAAYNDLPYAVGVGCGTDAIRIALLALGVKPGDSVASPAFNAAYAAQAVRSIGAKNVYVDIDPATMLMDPYDQRAYISANVKAVIPTHLFGLMCDMPSIMESARVWGAVVVEDAAQAHGAWTVGGRMPGHLGDVACYSHYPTKNLGCIGEGGSIVTRFPSVAEYARLSRDAGRLDRYVHQIDGINSMLDEIQAAALNVRLKYLTKQNDKRRVLAAKYRSALAGVGDIRFQENPQKAWHVYHLFVIRVCAAEREDFFAFLKTRGIPVLSHYPCTIPQQPFARAEGLPQGAFPHAEKAAAEVVSLPLWPSMREDEQDLVIKAVKEFYGA